MNTITRHLLCGLLLLGTVRATAGVASAAHASVNRNLKSTCLACIVFPRITHATVNGPDASGEYTITITGTGFTPNHQVYVEAIDTATNTHVRGHYAFADGQGNVQATLYPPLIDGCYWNGDAKRWDPVAVRLYDLVTNRWTSLNQVLYCVSIDGSGSAGTAASS